MGSEVFMSKKTFNLVSVIVGSVSAIATAICAYIGFPNHSIVVGAIDLLSSSIIGIMSKFVQD